MHVIRAAEGETVDSTGGNMFVGGNVWRRAIAGPDTGIGQHINFRIVQFGAGARTKLHTHTSDQLLYVVSGIGKVGTATEEFVVSAGDFVLIPAGEDHWHGAADTGSPMSHIAITTFDATSSVTGD
jgi:quercetin dioxygenase-like cupin family protein